MWDFASYVSNVRLVVWQVSISNKKSAEVSLRVAALEHLGTIAARLRKDERSAQDEESVQAYESVLQEVSISEEAPWTGSSIETDYCKVINFHKFEKRY